MIIQNENLNWLITWFQLKITEHVSERVLDGTIVFGDGVK